MKLIDEAGLRAKGIGFSRTHRWRLVRAGKFPQPVKFGDGPGCRNQWVEEEVDAFIAKRMAARGADVVALTAGRAR